MSILSAEYPGYGLHNKEVSSEQTLLEDAALIIRYCIITLNYQEENIILLGRSLGTGVAAKMGLIFPRLRGIMMISPYLSIRDVSKNVVGGIFLRFVPDIFRTKDIIKYLKPPVLFLHGLKDQLVPCTNSKYLYEHCNSPRMLYISASMDHNRFELTKDIYLPMLRFFVEKLYIDEFQEEYHNQNIKSVASICSLDKSETKSSKNLQKSMDRSGRLHYSLEKYDPDTRLVIEEEKFTD